MNAKLIIATLLWAVLLCGCKTSEQPQLGQPLADLTPAQRAQFEEGKKVFERVFVPEDGLGPLFNANACAQCHEQPVVGGVGDEVEVHATKFVAPDSCDPMFQQGGPVIQQHAAQLLQALGIEKEQIPPGAAVAHRSSPPLFGFGLVDAIPEATLLGLETSQAVNGSGIHGHANRTIDGRVGRFGRKAAVATLFEFSAGAFPQEMGVTTPLSPTEETINGVPDPAGTDPAADPEITVEALDQVTAFIRFLAPPPPQAFTNYYDQCLADRGRKIFAYLECAACHVEKMTTGTNAIRALDRKPVALYSDLLLHDMGAELADICLGQAHPSEFRTEMLMGLRFRERFLHDGSAATVKEAIARHAGEARKSRNGFMALSELDQKALLKFLQTL